MKYSRPVWELMGDCAAVLPDRFRFAHVQRWFDANYPDINERTLRVHLIGLTEGLNNPNPSLAKKPPLFRRIEHGEYEVIGRAVDVTIVPVDLDDGDVGAPASSGRVLLVAGEAEQRETPAPARDLFLAAEFVAVRIAADEARVPWFVLTSEYGLVAADAVIAPYERRIGRERRGMRLAWASWVGAKLASELDGLDGRTVDIHAEQDMLDPLIERLEGAGARVRLFDAGALVRDAAPSAD